MFSLLTSFGLFPAEVDTRKPLRAALAEAMSQPMRSYARWPRVLGILSILLFGFVAVTGLMLTFYYQPTPRDAHESVTLLVRDVSFGAFVHDCHGWGATALLVVLVLRVGRFFLQGMYKAPREALWVIAVLSCVVAALGSFTGRLLPFDARGYWITIRGLEVLGTLPVLGSLVRFFAGGESIDSLVLLRFYVLHVLILPALLLFLFYLHFSTVRRVGLSVTTTEAPVARTFRVHVYGLLILNVFILGGLVTLATLVPTTFHQAADPFSTPAGIRPPWYLLAPHAILEWLPGILPRWSHGLLLELGLVAVIALPFIDRSPGRGLRGRPLAVALGCGALAAWVALSWAGFRMEAGS
jgi:ubiquinol-cytochrome c reductase cytochrome b subunit